MSLDFIVGPGDLRRPKAYPTAVTQGHLTPFAVLRLLILLRQGCESMGWQDTRITHVTTPTFSQGIRVVEVHAPPSEVDPRLVTNTPSADLRPHVRPKSIDNHLRSTG